MTPFALLRRPAVLLALGATLLSACNCGGADPVTRLTFRVQPTDRTAGVAFAPAIEVVFEDADGNVVPAATSVAMTLVSDNGATLAGTTTVTSVDGVATFADLSVAQQGLYYRLSAAATVDGTQLTQQSNPFLVVAAAPAALAFAVPPSDADAGGAIAPPVRVTLQDAFGNITPSTAQVTVALEDNPTGATLEGTTTVAAIDGVATFAELSIGQVGEGYTLLATSGALPAVKSGPFGIRPGAAFALAFVTQPSDVVAGAAMASVDVEVQDARGNRMTTASGEVTLALEGGAAGAVLGGTTTAAVVDGVARFTGLSVDLAAAGYGLRATAGGVREATSATFAVTAGAPAGLAFRVQPGDAPSTTALAPAVQVALVDGFGNLTASAADVTLAIASGPAGAVLSGTATRAAVAGVASFDDLSLDLVGSYTLSASSAGLASQTSAAFEIQGGPPARVVFTVQPSNAVAGATLAPAVQVSLLDAAGNVATASSALVTLSFAANPSGALLGGTVAKAAVNGVATFDDLHIDRAGTGYSLRASSGSLTTATSSTFDISAGASHRLVFLTQPADTTAGAAIAPALQVEVQDAVGNRTASTAAVSLEIATGPGGAALLGTTTQAAVAGVATFSGLSLEVAGTYSLSASATGLLPATSAAFLVAPGAATRLAFVAQPSNVLAGATLTPAVQVELRDGFGNRTPSTAAVTLTLAGGTAGATLLGTATTTAAAGQATFADLSIARAGTGYTLAASAAGVTGAGSAAFDVTAGPAAALAFTVQPSSVPKDVPLSPAPAVTVQDAFGNRIVSSTAAISVAFGANPGGATLGGTTTRAAAGGVATFEGLTVDKAGTGYTLVASTAGLTSATSAAFNVAPASGLVYTDPPAGGKLRLVVNSAASTPATVVLDLVAQVPLTGYAVGFNLPLDATRVAPNATLMTPGSALPAGQAPIAAKAALPSAGPFASVLVSGQSQKAAGAGAVTTDTLVPAGAVLYTLRLDARAGAASGLVFDGANLGAAFRGVMRDKTGTDVAVSADFRIGRLDLY